MSLLDTTRHVTARYSEIQGMWLMELKIGNRGHSVPFRADQGRAIADKIHDLLDDINETHNTEF